MPMSGLFSLCLALSLTSAATAAELDEAMALPEPLSLEFALSLADAEHPDLQIVAAEQDIADAQRERAAAAYGINAGVSSVVSWIEPPDRALDQSQNDSVASLIVTKRLYDFGHTRANVAAATALHTGSQLRYTDAQTQRRLAILEAYLQVLLADLRFRVEDEAMAIAFVRVDRARDQHELGQLSEIALLAADTQYQETRSARYQAQAQQRITRVALAESLNRPGQLSSVLALPSLDVLERELPELQQLISETLRGNPQLRALRAETEAAREQLQAVRAADRAVISGRAEASEYNRQTTNNEPWSIGLQLDIPLYTGGRSRAELAQARAELNRSEAALARGELELRQSAQALWENIAVLRANREEAQTRIDYRELYLDRSRALYEMEVSTDLGDAMVVSSQAYLRQAEVDYQLLLDSSRLNALRGRPLFANDIASATQEGDAQ